MHESYVLSIMRVRMLGNMWSVQAVLSTDKFSSKMRRNFNTNENRSNLCCDKHTRMRGRNTWLQKPETHKGLVLTQGFWAKCKPQPCAKGMVMRWAHRTCVRRISHALDASPILTIRVVFGFFSPISRLVFDECFSYFEIHFTAYLHHSKLYTCSYYLDTYSNTLKLHRFPFKLNWSFKIALPTYRYIRPIRQRYYF